MADNRVNVQFGASTEDLKAGTEQVIGAIERIKSSIDGLKSQLETLGGAFAVLKGVEGVKEFVKEMTDLGTQTQVAAGILGVSTETVGQLGFVARTTGGSMESMTRGIEHLAINIQRSTNAFSPAHQALANLGLSTKDFIGLSADQYLLKLASAAEKFKADFQLSQNMMALGGIFGQQIIPILTQGKEKIMELRQEFRATGAEMSGATARAFDETGTKIELMRASVQGLGIRLFETLKPAIDRVVDATSKWIQSIKPEQIQAGVRALASTCIDMAEAVANFLVNIGVRFDNFKQSLANLRQEARNALPDWVSELDRGLSALQQKGLGLTVKELREAIRGDADDESKAFVGLGNTAGQQLATIKAKADEARAALARMLPPTGGEGRFGDADEPLSNELNTKKQIAAIDGEIRQKLQAQSAELDGQIKLAEQHLAQRKVQLQTEFDLGTITKTKEVELTKQAVQAEEAEELGYLQRKLALWKVEPAERAKIEAQIKELHEKTNTEMLKLDKELLDARKREWDADLNGIASAFNSQLRGLLQGTTTWSQAMHNIVQDLVIKIIELFEKITVLKPLENALNAAQIPPPTEFFANLLKMIQGLFGPLFAGFTANAAATSGPAAPAIGAAEAGAVVAAATSKVGSFAVGSWQIPGDMLAMVHKDEMVLDAANATKGRDLFSGAGVGGGGLGDVHFHINAMDTQTGASFLKNNIGVIADSLRREMRSGNLIPA